MKKYNIIESKFIEGQNHKLAYSQKGRKILSENKGLLKAFREMNHKKLTKYKDPKNRFTIKKVNNKIKTSTNEMYIIRIKKGKKKYFVKEINEEPTPNSKYPTFDKKLKIHLNGFYEMKALKILKDLGINIIDAHLGYLNIKSKKAYIIYDFTNLKILQELIDKKKIDPEEISRIKEKIMDAKIIIENSLYDRKYDINSQNGIIKGPRDMGDLVATNLFYEIKTKKMYFFDPWYIS
jgi:hypothetical protein